MKIPPITVFVYTTFRHFDVSEATLTIAAADSSTGQIGAVGTSCTNDSLYNSAYQGSPGNGLCLTVGAVVPSLTSSIYPVIDTLLSTNIAPQDIINSITSLSLDVATETIINGLSVTVYNAVDLRQYACVDLQLRAAGYTGVDIQDYYTRLGFDLSAGWPYPYTQIDIQGLYGSDIVYSAQGDIVSATTVTTLSNTFSSVTACDLAERLYLSLEAVYEAAGGPIGDVRCFDTNGASGSSLFLHVDDSLGNTVIHIETASPSTTVDPWSQFKVDYLSWRALNSCAPTSSPTVSQTSSSAGSLTIAAADSSTGQIGAVGTSCTNDSLYNSAYQASPGNGLCLTVGAVTPSLTSSIYPVIDTLLSTSIDPQVIINSITSLSLDVATETIINGLSLTVYNAVDLRQYACVDLQLRAAGYTGVDIQDYYTRLGFDLSAGWPYPYTQIDIQGLYGSDIVYSAQGDIVSATTVTTLSNTFSSVTACDLAERLYLSLEAVYEAAGGPIGDVRCFDTNGASGSSLFLHVDDSLGNTVIHIETASPSTTVDPWSQFKVDYLSWRALNSCAPTSSPTVSQTSSSAGSLTIAAADSSTGQIGAVGTSCTNDSLYNSAYQASPGNGLCLTVGAVIPSLTSSIYAVIDTLLSTSIDPQAIINSITSLSLDVATETIINGLSLTVYNAVDLRQYACVDLQLRAAGYTGVDIQDYYTRLGFDLSAGWPYPYTQIDIQGLYGSDIVYSAQGDIVSATTVTTLSNTFSSVTACDLAERLYLSLEAVYEAAGGPIGDVRCFDTNGVSGSSIFLHVDDSSGNTIIHIETASPSTTVDPWSQFKADYLSWRASNSCAPTSSPSVSRVPSSRPTTSNIPTKSNQPSISSSPTSPTASPTTSPSKSPTSSPLLSPSTSPTVIPTRSPVTTNPTAVPTQKPTSSNPTKSPVTTNPTAVATQLPISTSPTTAPISSAPTSPLSIFYPDWQGANTCVNDGKQPSWMYVSDPWNNKYFTTSQQECCDTWYFWDLRCVPPAVKAFADNSTGNPWYPDWQNSNTCQSDGKQPTWMYLSDGNVWEGHYFSQTQEECCDNFFWWDLKCMSAARSAQENPSVSTNPWYPDYASTHTCVSDGKQPSWMGDGYLKDSQKECCRTFYWWDSTC